MEEYAAALYAMPEHDPLRVPALNDIGFETTDLSALKILPGSQSGTMLFDDFLHRMTHYRDTHNFPTVKIPQLR